MTEAILNKSGHQRFKAYRVVSPEGRGIQHHQLDYERPRTIRQNFSKNWLDFTFMRSSDYDLVIKVCDHAAGEIWQLNTRKKSIGTLSSAFGMS